MASTESIDGGQASQAAFAVSKHDNNVDADMNFESQNRQQAQAQAQAQTQAQNTDQPLNQNNTSSITQRGHMLYNNNVFCTQTFQPQPANNRRDRLRFRPLTAGQHLKPGPATFQTIIGNFTPPTREIRFIMPDLTAPEYRLDLATPSPIVQAAAKQAGFIPAPPNQQRDAGGHQRTSSTLQQPIDLTQQDADSSESTATPSIVTGQRESAKPFQAYIPYRHVGRETNPDIGVFDQEAIDLITFLTLHNIPSEAIPTAVDRYRRATAPHTPIETQRRTNAMQRRIKSIIKNGGDEGDAGRIVHRIMYHGSRDGWFDIILPQAKELANPSRSERKDAARERAALARYRNKHNNQDPPNKGSSKVAFQGLLQEIEAREQNGPTSEHERREDLTARLVELWQHGTVGGRKVVVDTKTT